MDSVSQIFHNPSFKKDFNFISTLQKDNLSIQNGIWEKFIGTYSRKEQNVQVVNTRFESHPSSFSTDESEHDIDEDLKDEPVVQFSNEDFRIKPKERSRTSSVNKMVLNDASREKLRKKLYKHLKNGTIEKFKIETEEKEKSVQEEREGNVKESVKAEDKEEVYLDHWRKPSGSTRSVSRSMTSSEENLDKPAPLKIEDMEMMQKRTARRTQEMKTRFKIRDKRRKSVEKKEEKKSIQGSSVGEMRKSRYYIEKSIRMINDIGSILEQTNVPPDGSDDFHRRTVRTKEFASRFSRIYLYPLFRQLADINLPMATERKPNYLPKFTAMHQIIFQALQATFNHLPSTVGTASYHKLKEHLSCAIEVCDKNSQYLEQDVNNDNGDYINILKSRCLDLIEKLNDNFMSASLDSLLRSKSTRTSLIPASQKHRHADRLPNSKGTFEKRFSMYKTPLANKRDNHWRKIMENLEGNKPKVKSRYRTATFKHRPPVDKPYPQMMMAPPEKHRFDDKRSLTLLRNTPVATPLNEDNIETMIQFEGDSPNSDRESEKEDEEYVGKAQGKTIIAKQQTDTDGNDERNQDDILTKLLQLVQDNHQEPAADPDANLTNTILVLQQCLNFKNEHSDKFKKLTKDNQPTFSHQTDKMIIEETKTIKKEPEVTVTGTKNAQLICIKDDNSIVSNASEEDGVGKVETTLISAEVQTSNYNLVAKDEVKSVCPIGNIKISRMNRPVRMLKLLPKEYAINVIQYKLSFHKHHKGDYMYRRTPTINPWELMDKISEEVLDYALLEIAKEIEVNELLENIYNSEFQY